MGSSKSKSAQKDFNSQKTQPFINTSSPYNLDKQIKPDPNDQSQSSNRQLQTQSPLKMPMHNTYKCSQCGMIFSSDEALYKHRIRYCTGGSTERKIYYSDDEELYEPTKENYLRNNQSPIRRTLLHQSPIEKKREEVYEWKNQRSMRQSVQDMEDKILLDSHKTQKLANDLRKRTEEYNRILIEYERLQDQERDLLRQMFNLQDAAGSHFTRGLTEYEEKQLEILQRQTARLAQERRIIQNRLEELIASDHQPAVMTQYEPYRLLRDMKEEQDRNEKTLLTLRRRLMYPHSDIPSLPDIPTRRRTNSEDVRTFRNGYLHSNKYELERLRQSSDLDHRLRYYEYYPWMKEKPEPLKYQRYGPNPVTNDQLVMSQNENQRLQHELDNMERKYEKLDSRTRQLEIALATKGPFEPNSNMTRHQSLKSLNDTSYGRYDNQFQSYREPPLPAIDKRVTPYGAQPRTNMNSNMRLLQDPLGPQPYDPIGGFVIFFDFILHLSPNIEQCRLITCLHHPLSGLGEPSQLQPAKSEFYTDDSNGERMNIAIVATKQPVPRCPPQQTLTTVIEIQLTTKQAPAELLRTQAWAKLPLFDHRNRLLSGRWKIPLKTLPINQDESFSIINSLPTYGRAELYYRLVNIQDAADQSHAPLSPNFKDLYFYPPQYRNRSYM